MVLGLLVLRIDNVSLYDSCEQEKKSRQGHLVTIDTNFQTIGISSFGLRGP